MVRLSANNSRFVLQNMGLIDRLARFVVGAGLLVYAVPPYASWGASIPLGTQMLLIGISVYALLTCTIGWDPFYALLHIRSGSLAGRNQCGTIPYEVKALMGQAPKYCDSDELGIEHSLEACSNTPEEHPHHALWAVEREPMIYPSDAQLNVYFLEQARKQRRRKGGMIRRAA